MKQSAHTARHVALTLLLACILAVSAIQMPVSAGGAITPEPVLSGSVSVTVAPVVSCAVCISTRTLSMRISAARVAQPMVDSVAET